MQWQVAILFLNEKSSHPYPLYFSACHTSMKKTESIESGYLAL
jgi:hypothetical protein